MKYKNTTKFKWKTKVESDTSKQFVKKTKMNVFIASILFISENIINTLLPFIFGFYFALYNNLIFLFLFIPFLFFQIKTYFDGKNIKISIIKRIVRNM